MICVPNAWDRNSSQIAPFACGGDARKDGAGSTGRCNTGLQLTRRRLKAQGLSRALVEKQRNLVEMGLSVDGQVGLLKEVLS